jgi:three-Cys-motif partner protein
MNSTDSFFSETTDQSEVKRSIIQKYFSAWSKVVIPTVKSHDNKIAYIDLFAGPGRYDDGKKSTPILILEKAIQDDDLRNMLVTLFNDKNENYSSALENAINEIPNIEKLKYKPKVYNNEIGEEIVKMFEKMKLVPTLFFVDPWGYKGLSLRLVNSVLKDWGCDCIFFFNYNRINMGLGNEFVVEHMNSLFGEKRANALRVKISEYCPEKREFAIVEELVLALKELGGNYVLPFCFKAESGKRTTHHLIFVSKHFKGYGIMKDIMAKESSSADQGVPSFVYNPADINFPNLFEYTRPLDDLAEMLIKEYAGKTIKMKDIYLDHSVGKRYISRNYKSVLCKLEKEGKIVANPPAENRRKIKGEVSFSDDVIVKFP